MVNVEVDGTAPTIDIFGPGVDAPLASRGHQRSTRWLPDRSGMVFKVSSWARRSGLDSNDQVIGQPLAAATLNSNVTVVGDSDPDGARTTGSTRRRIRSRLRSI